MADNDWTDPAVWGNRADNSPKGSGYFGVLKRPDGSVSSELSIGVNMNGQEVEIPALVPALTPYEVKYMLGSPHGQAVPPQIIQKAVDFARQRAAAGQPYFAQAGEQSAAYPDLPRSHVTAPGASFMVPSHGQAAYARDPKYLSTLGLSIRDLVERSLRGQK